MLTDDDIARLVGLPKVIVNQTPSAGYSKRRITTDAAIWNCGRKVIRLRDSLCSSART